LQQRRANSQQRLRALRQLNSDQIGFNHCQAAPLQDFSPAVGIIDEEANERALRGVIDRKGADTDAGTLEPPDDFEQLSDTIFEKDCELSKRGEISSAQRFVLRIRSSTVV
jgi:hypothetical protein